jgi:hypothetical protein
MRCTRAGNAENYNNATRLRMSGAMKTNQRANLMKEGKKDDKKNVKVFVVGCDGLYSPAP